MPAAKNCSASFSVETVMPRAPGAQLRRATVDAFAGLHVRAQARRRAPFMRCCMRAMLRCMRAASINAARGVEFDEA